MKKLILVVAVIATASLVSCAGKKAQETAIEEANQPEAVNVEVVEATAEGIVGDSLVTDTVVGVAVTPAE